jgi:NAD(P)-dependent dehydrogenase (short-subunit alcohol dehydrogenase family)
MVEKVVKDLGGLDILVNNAGRQIARESILDIKPEEFDETFKTNVYAMFWITQAAIPHMKAGSAIINTTSINAYDPNDTMIDYAATKGAIMIFTKGLAKQLAEKGIRVNAVAPGPVWTPLNPADKAGEQLEEFGARTPMGRPAQPEEIAPAFVFLASPQTSSYITGEILPVIGGY